MNKLFSKIAALSVGLAMAVGVGVALGHQGVREAKAAEGDTLLTFNSATVVGGTATSYTSYSDDNWDLNIGGNKVSAGWNKTAANARQVGEKYAINSEVTSTTYGWVASTKASVSNAGKLVFTYTAGSGNGSGKLWLASSTDGTTYTEVTLTNGTQGSSCGTANTNYTFEFDTIDSAYYAIIVTGGASGSAFRFDNVTATLYEGATGGDPSKDTLVVKLNDATESPLTLDYSPTGSWLFYANDKDGKDIDSEWSSSDESVFTVSENGNNVAVVVPHNPGTANLVASADGFNDGVFVLTVNAGSLESLDVNGSMSKTSYTTNDVWSPAGLTVTGTYETGYVGDVTDQVEWSYDPAAPAASVTSVVATATIGSVSDDSAAQAVTVEESLTITLNSSNWPVSATATHDDAQTSTYGGVTYENVRGYKYSNQLSLNYKVDAYFGNKTPFPRNIKSIVVTYTANVTSYVKMYESDTPLAKTTLVSSSGTTTVTYTFSDTTQYFRLNMDTSTPKGTYCNVTSIVITLGSAADLVDLENISVNENVRLADKVTFASTLTKVPENANNKDTISWSSSNPAVATVDSEGKVTTVGAGTAVITATATDLVGVSASYTVTVFEANPIERIYYSENGSSLDFNGKYIGLLSGSGFIVMNGEFGILLYNKNATGDPTGISKGDLVNVKATLSIYSGLYEAVSFTIDGIPSATDVEEPVTYTVTGNETQIHESRETLVSGIVKSVSGSWTSDTTVVVTVNSKDVTCFAKANAIDAETGAKIVAGADVTLTGFTGWHNGFQVTINGLVETGTYTLDQFVSEFLSLTATECGAEWEEGSDHKSGLQTNVWNVLNTAEKYGALSAEDKAALRTTEPEKGSDLEKALERYDFLVGKYFGAAGDFLGRGIDFVNGSSYSFSSVNNNNSYIIIIVISAVSVMSFGLALFLRKKRSK